MQPSSILEYSYFDQKILANVTNHKINYNKIQNPYSI